MAPTTPAPSPAGAPAGSSPPSSVNPPPPSPGQDAEEPELAYESDLPEEDDDDEQPEETDLDRNPSSGASQARGAAAQPGDDPHRRTGGADRGDSVSTPSRAVTTGGWVVLGAVVAATAVALSRASRRHQDRPSAAPPMSAAKPAVPARASVNRWWPLLLQLTPVLIAWLPARWRRRAPALHELAKAAPPLAGVLRSQG